MGRLDRREKLALDESYRYYRSIEHNGGMAELYRLVHCLKTLQNAVSISDHGQFKLTVQLWKRLQQGFFDKLITSFPGCIMVYDEAGNQVPTKAPFPESGMVEFHPDGCHREDDLFQIEIKHLYPATFYNLSKLWKKQGQHISPEEFTPVECGPSGCLLKPVLFGQEVLDQESQTGKTQAYHDWWELYWQAYCSRNRHDKNTLYKQMDEIESVWGNLYY